MHLREAGERCAREGRRVGQPGRSNVAGSARGGALAPTGSAILLYRRTRALVLQHDPTHGEAQMNLAIAYHRKGALDLAAGRYQQAIALMPASGAAKKNYGLLQQALASKAGG